MLHLRKRFVACAVLATVASADSSFSNVKITQFQQAGLDLSFLVSWTTAESPTADSDLVDIWLQTRQPDYLTFVDTILQKVLSCML